MSRIILSDRGSFLGKSGEQFRITRKDGPEVLVPARKVQQILVLGSGISVSSDAVEMADQLGTEIVFAGGDDRARRIDQHGADLLFQVISRRYERGSILLTTNRPFKQWAAIFNNDNTLASAVLDRLLHHAQTLVIEGQSYRMKDQANP